MQLQQLASLVSTGRIVGDGKTQIGGIQIDSRKVVQGDLFICLQGHTVDGHTFAPRAVASGASALVVDHALELDVPQINRQRYTPCNGDLC